MRLAPLAGDELTAAALAMLLRRAASLLSGRSALVQRLPSLSRTPPPLLGGLLHARHVYTPPKAENSPPAPGERLAVLFPRGKRLQVSMEVKKRVLKSNPHMGGKRLKRMVRKHAQRGSYNSFVAEYESRLDRFLWRINVAASPFASRVLITKGHVMVNGAVVKQHSHLLKPYAEPVEMAAALASGSTTRPLLPQPWAGARVLVLISAPSPFEGTRQPSKGSPETEHRRPTPRPAPRPTPRTREVAGTPSAAAAAAAAGTAWSGRVPPSISLHLPGTTSSSRTGSTRAGRARARRRRRRPPRGGRASQRRAARRRIANQRTAVRAARAARGARSVNRGWPDFVRTRWVLRLTPTLGLTLTLTLALILAPVPTPTPTLTLARSAT